MDEAHYTLVLRALPPEPGRPHWTDGTSPRQRLGRALKLLLRVCRLRCLQLIPDPQAWAGWYQLPGQDWQRSCTAVSPQLCWIVLQSRIVPGACLAVLPGGIQP